MITEHYHNLLNRLDTIRRQVELLESHKTTGMITKEQYEDTGTRLEMQVKAIEDELGIKPEIDAKAVIFDKTKSTEETDLDAEIFNLKVHKEIEDVIDNR